MNREVASALKRIDTVAKTLNQTSDQLSQKIVEIETALNQYKLGVWAWLEKPLLEEPDCDETARYQWQLVTNLGYGKIREKWGLLISVYPDYDPDENSSTVFLKEAPRGVRALAVERIPELLARIADEAANLNQQIAEKAELANEIAASLKKTN
jgi:hypothetical protein